MSKADDLTRLRHILDSAKLALTLVAGATRETLNQDIKLVLAIVRLLEVIGEAANHVSVETQTQIPQIPQIPWRQLVGMRNRLIHAYFDVDLEVI
ncbi:MAG: HepT-like ribonuclease domain-containing protein [Prochlorothrix sp.]|nr:HepT-like ribonuclease domain-containing protein [Prochlorothrix sp.]